MIGGRWYSKIRWEVGDWTHKQVEGGRLTYKTGGKWEVKVDSDIAISSPWDFFKALLHFTIW